MLKYINLINQVRKYNHLKTIAEKENKIYYENKIKKIIEFFINENYHGVAIMLENGRFRDAALLIKVYNDKNYASFIDNTNL